VAEEESIKIQDYQIHLPPLGEGTFGRVYRATYRGISDRALKIFRPGAVDLSAMARELEKLSSVAEHSGIVTLHDFDLLHDPPYYAMGLHADQATGDSWETRTLEQLCGKIDHRSAWRVIRDIADALAYLHRNQIVHCDVKPSNILLTDETPHRVKICDFGQSRGNAAENFKAVGTPLYASPEQLRNPRDSSEGRGFRWDVYSFGVVAFKLLTGVLPRLQPLADAERKSFDPESTLNEASVEATLADSNQTVDGERLATMTEAVEEIEWPSWFALPSDRRDLIEQCLSLDPLDRPADMREVFGRIQQIDQLQVVRRARRLNGIFAALLVIAIWASGFAFVQARKAKASAEDAEELALIIVNELNRRNLSAPGMDQLYALIADHSETFLANLPKDHRRSGNTLRFSAQTASLRGRQALDRGDLEEALSRFTNAFEIRQSLAEMDVAPGEMALLASRDLAAIGRVHEQNDDLAKAASRYEEALVWLRRSMSGLDAIPLAKLRESTGAHESLARVLNLQGKSKEAVATLRTMRETLEEHLASANDAEKPALRREILLLLENLGGVQLGSGNLAQAEETFVELLNVGETLENASPSYRDEARASYMNALHKLGLIQLSQDQGEAALVLFREEIKKREESAALRPYDPELRISLAEAYAKASDCLDPEDPSERSLAIFYLRQAITLLSRLPPDLRKLPSTEERSIAYNEQLSILLEREE